MTIFSTAYSERIMNVLMHMTTEIYDLKIRISSAFDAAENKSGRKYAICEVDLT
jgi:hypothetical protein